jgi:hypothetical protein
MTATITYLLDLLDHRRASSSRNPDLTTLTS